jgi:hypothetical protein
MTDLRTAAQQALEAMTSFESGTNGLYEGEFSAEIAALKAALAEPVQEPVAWLHTDPDKPRVKFLEWREDEPGYRGRWIKTPLYTTPPPRKPLPQAEIERLYITAKTPMAFARSIEQAHGITS